MYKDNTVNTSFQRVFTASSILMLWFNKNSLTP